MFTVTPNTFYFITVFVSNTLFKTKSNTSTETLKAGMYCKGLLCLIVKVTIAVLTNILQIFQI